MVEPLFYGSLIQLVIGTALFVAAGYFVTRALFGEVGAVEKIVFTIVFGFFAPATAIFVLNYFFGFRIGSIEVAIIYALIAAAAFWLASRKSFFERKRS